MNNPNCFLSPSYLFPWMFMVFSAVAFSSETHTEKGNALLQVLGQLGAHYFRPLTQEELGSRSLEELFSKLDSETALRTSGPASSDFVRGLAGEGSISSDERVGKELGCIKFTFFGRRTGQDLDRILGQLQNEGTKKLIIDLRGNSGGELQSGLDLIERFIPQGKLMLIFRGRENTETKYFSRKAREISTPLFVLIDRDTASTAEIVAYNLKQYGQAVLVGEPTRGKRSVQETFPIDSSHLLFLTTGFFEFPNQSQTKEILPDISVPAETALKKAIAIAKGGDFSQ